jgi:molecular chaperone IbpA
MTRYNTLNNPWFIGFDELARRLENLETADNYPPHNIIKVDDDHYTIELAVAGFSESELDITVKDSVLTVTGTKEDSRTYIHKGVSTRKFVRKFTLNEYVDVTSADLENGILSLNMERHVPEEERPRKIAIGKSTAKKTFLSES